MNSTPPPEKLCPKCRRPMVAENAGPNVRYTCTHDGVSEVRDNQGRQYLADTSTPSNRRTLLG